LITILSTSYAAEHVKPRSQTDILYDLFIRSNLSPYACSVLTQIILTDLRPLLSPLPPEALNFTTALLVEHEAVPQLDIFEALEMWDWEARLLHVVLDEIESRGGGAGGRQRPPFGLIANPVDLVRPGVNVEASRSRIPCGPGNKPWSLNIVAALL
jgi:DNA ligase-4